MPTNDDRSNTIPPKPPPAAAAGAPSAPITFTTPISVTPERLLATVATVIADECATNAADAGKWRFISVFLARIIEMRGIDDAARFAAGIFGWDVLDAEPKAVIA